jgi:hypothetical protein
MRPAAGLVLVGALGAGCDALLNIPSQETYEGDGGPQRDATLPADVGADAATSDADGGQDATLADARQDAHDAGDAASEAGPDCATTPDTDWANWPMPNSSQDIEAGSPNPASYVDNHDATVTDVVTGLMWQQQPAPTTLAWNDAGKFCKDLRLATHADWRLPSYIELVSLLDYGDASPVVNASYFPGTPQNYFWSSTPFTSSSTQYPPSAWFVDFAYGENSNDMLTSTYYVRCVRGASP